MMVRSRVSDKAGVGNSVGGRFEGEVLSFWENWGCGAAAGSVSAVATQPIDVRRETRDEPTVYVRMCVVAMLQVVS